MPFNQVIWELDNKSRYAYGKFSNTHEATIGGCFLTRDEELDDHIVKYEIWDTAG
jgi:GTPase SAR1 family protein